MSSEPWNGAWLHSHSRAAPRRTGRSTHHAPWQTVWAPQRRERAVGYVVAVPAQIVAVSLTRQLNHLWPGFTFPSALSLLVVALVALYCGTAASAFTTLVGAALLYAMILAPHGIVSPQPTQLTATLLFVAVGLSIGALASRSERARRLAQVAAVRATQSYSAEHEQDKQGEGAEQATQRLQALSALSTVLDVALGQTNLDDLLRQLLARITAAFAVDNTAILLHDEAGQHLVVYMAHGPEDALAGKMRVPVGQGFAGRIAASRQPLIVADTTTVPVVNPLLHEALHSLMGVPLLVDGRLIGVLHVGTATPRRFTADDLETLRIMAERVALAIEHVRLYSAERGTGAG